MIMAEKIVTLRKRRGWSQEELADKLGVSRQAVSKWEMDGAVPEADKIVALSGLFGVTTDYLLKDDGSVAPPEIAGVTDERSRFVSGEEARKYIGLVRKTAPKFGLATALCFVSPILLMLLSAFVYVSNSGVTIGLAIGIGTAFMLIVVAVGVALIIGNSMRLSEYKYLKTDTVTLAPEVRAELKKEKNDFARPFIAAVTAGTTICILAIVPLMLSLGLGLGGFTHVFTAGIMLALFSVGIFLFVRYGSVRSGYSKLLMEDNYTAENKRAGRGLSVFPFIYWGVIIAVYLAVGFGTRRWDMTWLVWPIAGVLFFVFYSIMYEILKNKK